MCIRDRTYTVTAYYGEDLDASTTFVLEAPIPLSLSVVTNSKSYQQGEIVRITGEVSGFNEYTGPVGLTVKGPQGNIIYNGNLPTATDGKFGYDIKGIQGPAGTYTVTAYYLSLIHISEPTRLL